jgi:hypothetical protein
MSSIPPVKPSRNGGYVRKRVASLRPSPENSELYGELEGIDQLAESIQKRGLIEPLIITLDKFIVSGHRRLAALKKIGQFMCLCRVLRVRRSSMDKDAYLALLREHNRQRHKTVNDQWNEELLDLAPEECHRRLCHRWYESVNPLHEGLELLDIEGENKRYKISPAKAQHVEHIKKVIFEDRKDYWPLSVRGVHYGLLNYRFLRNIRQELWYQNDQKCYDATSDLLTRLRLDGTVPWEALDDFTRPLQAFHPFTNVRQFIQHEMENLFAGYWRNLQQSQPCYVEVFVEKNTVFHLANQVTSKYQIWTSSGRGFNAADCWHDLWHRKSIPSMSRPNRL